MTVFILNLFCKVMTFCYKNDKYKQNSCLLIRECIKTVQEFLS